jgi:putative ABC transport system permease protein
VTGRLREALARLFAFLGRRSHAGAADVAEELRFHREMLQADLRRRGLDEAAARRQAAVLLGGQAQTLERCGDQRSIPVLESVVQDARYALRSFRRAPAFTLAALLTLALGIGATTAIFSVVHAVLLRPLPFPDAGAVVTLGTDRAAFDNVGYATIADLRDRTRTLAGLGAIRSWQPTLVVDQAERLDGMRVSWNYFELLGVAPALGRTFTPADDHPDRYRVVVLSDALWRRRFGADPAVIGRALRMNDQQYEIVGVMPAGFDDVVSGAAYQPAELWAALGYDASLPYACRSCQHLRAIGRLRPGATAEQAGGDLTAIRAELMRQYPTQYPPGRFIVTRLQDVVAGPVREPLLVLLGAVGFVLLIACANVANLLLARALTRTREMAVRAALGAGRRRLVRQMVTESVLLWSLGGIAGVAVAALLLRLASSRAPADLASVRIALDLPVLGFAAVVSVLTGLVFGLLPAAGATSTRLGRALAASTRGSVGASPGRVRQGLVVLNLAIALVLLAGAGLMLKSVAKLLTVDPGFSSTGVLTAQLSLVGQAYREDAAVYSFIRRLTDRVRAIPGVDGAAIAGQIPMGGNGDRLSMHIEGLEQANPAEAPAPERYSVTPDYFGVMGIPLVRGRLIGEQDTPTSEPVLLVSATAAAGLFAGGEAIGRRVRLGGAPNAPWRTIVGVVGDVRHADLTETVWPQMYLPQSQFTDSFLVLTVRTSMPEPSRLVPAIRAALREQDATVPLYQVSTLDDLVARSVAQRRFVMLLLVGFAGLSLLLAAVGLYGVISYTVAGRTREVGLRVALGATRGHVFRLVLGSGIGTVAIGLLGGLAGALLLTGVLEGQLYGVEPLDPAALAAAVGILAVVAAAAHAAPVRRALRVNPTVALRDD